ncbi:unnamed protein product, partial [Chrysoparadoxa australica]
RAYKGLRELVKAHYVKQYHEDEGCYFYLCKITGALSRDKPLLLGSEDLPSPRFLENTPRRSSVPQFALLISSGTFESGKIP